MEYAGSVPFFASLRIRAGDTTWLYCGPNRHSAKFGQIDHATADTYSFQDRCFASRRSKIVGTHFTFVDRNAPRNGYFFGSSTPARAGTQEGCSEYACVAGSIHAATLCDAQPQPVLCGWPLTDRGRSPVKLSWVAAAG